jgi:drug/metabolite transporter (DMT)-like permease
VTESVDRTATGLGLGAVLLWAILASLTALAGPIPPFQLAAMTFAIGTVVGLIYARVTRQSLSVLRAMPLGAWALGIYGLFAFHTCYFFALQRAPALEASLVIYLWPLLIVVFSGFLPARLGGQGLRWWHLAGAGLGFAGTILILLDASGRPDFQGSLAGYALALTAALIWSSYSVASRLYQGVPSVAVIGSCAVTCVGSAALHLGLETTVWPAGLASWGAIIGLGLGPVGLAFYIWDEGMKRGDLRLLGAAAYATPLLSTVIMAGLGLGRASLALLLAAAMITGGAALAAKE